MHLPGSALEGGAVLEGEGQAAIRVGRGIIQQAAPERFAEGGALMFGIYNINYLEKNAKIEKSYNEISKLFEVFFQTKSTEKHSPDVSNKLSIIK